MRRRAALAAVLAGALAGVAAACAGGGDGLGRVVAASMGVDGPVARFEALRTLDGRVGAVFHRLITANLELCPHRGFSAGWTLHAANQYSGDLKAGLAGQTDLVGDLPGVLALAPGGPAEAAGLLPDDVITAVNGAPLAIGRLGGPARYEGVAANLAVLDAALAEGRPAALTVKRGGEDRTITLTPVAACAYSVQLDPSEELNARADGRRVFISTALAGFAGSDADLALILGHELAHNVLRHRERFDREAPGRRVLGNLAVAPASLAAGERDADRWGLYLMARAGYPVEGAPAFWRAFGQANWRVRWAQWGHPSAETRARQLEGVVAEIALQAQKGEPLDPR